MSVCCADVEFGRLQARDLLQHLWTGPISNAPVNIVQGSKSVEVRPVGISKVTPLLHFQFMRLLHVEEEDGFNNFRQPTRLITYAIMAIMQMCMTSKQGTSGGKSPKRWAKKDRTYCITYVYCVNPSHGVQHDVFHCAGPCCLSSKYVFSGCTASQPRQQVLGSHHR